MSTPLRGAIIGCGFFAQFHLEAWRRIPDVDIVAAVDPMLDKAHRFAPRAYSTARELFESERLDFVDIATRPDTHLELVQLAVQHNVAAICQKPLARDIEEALEFDRITRNSLARVMVHENWRWQPWFREAKRRIQAGDIGQPVNYHFRTRQRDGLGPEPYPNQPYFRQMPRLLLYETLIHHLDTSRFLFGDLKSIYARTRRKNPLIAGEDRAILLADHASDVDGIIDGHRYLDPAEPGPAMGEAWLEGDENWIRITAGGDLYLGRQHAWSPGALTGYKGESVFATQKHFVDCLLSGEPFETGISEYLGSFLAIEAAYRSAAEQRPVCLSELMPSRER
ncbi:MAG TPA: Gfo/Idh/MocA family oxidoreductase [Bryobacteraceae bacterium]|nr:Gfo/Idh/MocA family oxidoreductase [Bryobacteraceae bacterium]